MGEALIGELNCIACHSASDDATDRLMPRNAPFLGQVGKRLSSEFLDAYLRDPHGQRPGTAMPHLFNDIPPAMMNTVVENLVHFLASQGGPFDSAPRAFDDLAVAQGRFLYHQVGCVACHTPFESAQVLQHDLFPIRGATDDPYATPEEDAPSTDVPPIGMSLASIGRKTNLAQLTAFLADPTSVHPSGRMPDMNLTNGEAHQVASYLMSQTAPDASTRPMFVLDPDKAKRGETFFAAMGCAHCHQDMGPNRTPIAPMPRPEPIPALRDLKGKAGQGCLATDVEAGLADYELDQSQRTAIAHTLDHIDDLATPMTAQQRVGRFMTAGSCLACHSRDETGGVPADLRAYFLTLDEADLGDEGRIPPILTGVGAKLRPAWLTQVITQGTQVRPYMAARMPKFNFEQVPAFVHALESLDAPCPIDELPPDSFSEVLRNDGRILFGLGGMSCINCHAIAGHEPLGEPAMDLVNAHERLRSDWYRAYMADPSGFRPGTRMPNHWPPDQANPFPSIQDGDDQRQIEAIWAYLSQGQFMPLPQGIETGEGFELVVLDKPMVFRTFIEGTGSRAIAIGFPEQVHAAFDAATCRLDQIWRGPFLSASGAWAGRGGNATDPLGQEVIQMPPGPPIVSLAGDMTPWPGSVPKDTAYRFKGYALDEQRVPTLNYQFGPTRIAETLTPIVRQSAPGMKRTIALAQSPDERERLFLRLASAQSVERRSDTSFLIDNRITITIDAPDGCVPSVRTIDDHDELLIHLAGNVNAGPLTLSLLYTW